MTSDAVVEFLGLMEASSLEVCLNGGWGIYALSGEQTREHKAGDAEGALAWALALDTATVRAWALRGLAAGALARR